MANARSFCVALRDITTGQRRRWASLDDVIAGLGMDRTEADQLTARLRSQGMLEFADGDRLRLTEKGRRTTGGSRFRGLGIRFAQTKPAE
jgi:Mn-dependent DtxR family transcriptional regulator